MNIKDEIEIQKKIFKQEKLSGEASLLTHLIHENFRLEQIINEIIDNQKFFSIKISQFGNLDNKIQKLVEKNTAEIFNVIMNHVDESLSIQKTSRKNIFNELSNAEKGVIIGKSLISQLSEEEHKKHFGKFVAITLKGDIISTKNTLKELNEDLARQDLSENYYIEQIGSESIAKIL